MKIDSKSKKPEKPGIFYFHRSLLPSTPDVAHELIGYQFLKYSDFTDDLQTTASDPTGIIATLLRNERRIARQATASRLFYNSPSYGVALKAHFGSLPNRTSVIFNFGLCLDEKGYSAPHLLTAICDFLLWQMQEVKLEKMLHLEEVSIPEVQVLRSSQALVQLYWASAILAKYCRQIEADKR